MEPKDMTTEAILARIAELQEIQKRNNSKSKAWQDASDELQPLFAEMARREPADKCDSGRNEQKRAARILSSERMHMLANRRLRQRRQVNPL